MFTDENTYQSQDSNYSDGNFSGSGNMNEDSNMSFMDNNTQDYPHDPDSNEADIRLGELESLFTMVT